MTTLETRHSGESRNPDCKPEKKRAFSIPAFAGMTMLLLVTSVHAAFFVGEGGTGQTFLKIPMSARAAALGGSFTSISGDISSIEYNPAGLANMPRTDLMATYLDYLQDTSLQAISIGFPISLGRQPMSYNEAQNSFIDTKVYIGFQYRLFHAKDETRDINGIKGEEFDIRDQALDMSMAYPVSPQLSLGLGGKYIGSNLQNESLSTYGFDAGAQYKWDAYTFGASVMNMGADKAYVTEKDPLPTLARLGASRRWKYMTLMTDVSDGRDKIVRGSAGAEFDMGPYVRLRGGIVHDTELQFAGGLGIRFKGPEKAPVVTSPRKRVDIDSDSRKSLEDLNAPPDNSGSKDLFSNIDIGLDYGLTTHNDIGITHTVSLRILY